MNSYGTDSYNEARYAFGGPAPPGPAVEFKSTPRPCSWIKGTNIKGGEGTREGKVKG